MKVLYRITDISSTNPSPIHQDNKPRLNRLCLKSFLHVYKGIKLDITFLCDFCEYDTIKMIQDLCPKAEIIQTRIGINETMVKAYNIAKESESECILFIECDYYWIKPITEAQLQCLSLISPYDHPDFYTRYDIHPKECEISLIGDQHFRTAKRNTMTFGMTRECLNTNFESLIYWGYLDNDVWDAMRKTNYPLWTPISSFATHMVKDFLAPSIKWHELWSQ